MNPTKLTLTRDDKWNRRCVWMHYPDRPPHLLFGGSCYWDALKRAEDMANVWGIENEVIDKPH